MALESQVLRMLRFSIASFEIREDSNNVPAISGASRPITCSDAAIPLQSFRLNRRCYKAKQACNDVRR